MLPLILVHFIAGAILARYFRVLILVPAIIMSTLIMIFVQTHSDMTLFNMMITGAISITALQAGYIFSQFAYAKMPGQTAFDLRGHQENEPRSSANC